MTAPACLPKHWRSGAHARPIRVLVAEDAPGLHQLLCLLLEMEDDFQVVGGVVDGAQTLAAAEELRPDLVVLDLDLPVVSGLDALARLRRLLPEATIVVFSAFEATRFEPLARRRGADAYVEKDAGALQIVQRLREACAAR